MSGSTSTCMQEPGAEVFPSQFFQTLIRGKRWQTMKWSIYWRHVRDLLHYDILGQPALYQSVKDQNWNVTVHHASWKFIIKVHGHSSSSPDMPEFSKGFAALLPKKMSGRILKCLNSSLNKMSRRGWKMYINSRIPCNFYDVFKIEEHSRTLSYYPLVLYVTTKK